ncbi:chemotaxis protein CheW [Desulfuromonas thiophila]|jgi:purine-binding chemotaxis protein CheW|uniref:Chemotaxis protein CheW n=1 Tax=Desulfuromonas thiophila TaxID=57664 RepID=A0A1G7AME5_9BACT|nr:chemotaxis protein CheW [Desulfuromonas thiophila]MCK9171852.1 chemotaxis protein CheW [Desulfuromonas thiophila]MDD3800831.1 chemotaxis protein CheW [Desulfuromonas thiophila]MDY0398494.1 chemotaxis protein CheW [Desulfuromonas thiophila]SDE16094.1 CheW protein [Desulfuromonas thiophila]
MTESQVLVEKDGNREDTQEGKYLTFHMGDEDYGIEIRYVIEIIGIQRITEVPDMPPYIKGVINLRGKVIPVMDVRARFNLPPRDYDERTCIVVVQLNETSVGLVVDKVNEVADIPPENIEPPPRSTAGGSSQYIQGMGKMGDRVKILLNVAKLLYDSDLEEIEL